MGAPWSGADPSQTGGRLTAGEVEGGADRQLPLARSGALGGIRRPPRGYSGLVPKSKNQTKICVPSCRSKVDLGACRNSRRATCPDELCISASTPTSMTPKPSDHRHVRRGATGPCCRSKDTSGATATARRGMQVAGDFAVIGLRFRFMAKLQGADRERARKGAANAVPRLRIVVSGDPVLAACPDCIPVRR
jgi:hypothetical protein